MAGSRFRPKTAGPVKARDGGGGGAYLSCPMCGIIKLAARGQWFSRATADGRLEVEGVSYGGKGKKSVLDREREERI